MSCIALATPSSIGSLQLMARKCLQRQRLAGRKVCFQHTEFEKPRQLFVWMPFATCKLEVRPSSADEERAVRAPLTSACVTAPRHSAMITSAADCCLY
jgi:hypothetical protein